MWTLVDIALQFCHAVDFSGLYDEKCGLTPKYPRPPARSPRRKTDHPDGPDPLGLARDHAPLPSAIPSTTVHQRLQEVGIQIPYRRLSLYIGRLRRENAACPPVPVIALSDIAVAIAAPPPGPSSIDSLFRNGHQTACGKNRLAAIRRQRTCESTLTLAPALNGMKAPPDKEKLF